MSRITRRQTIIGGASALGAAAIGRRAGFAQGATPPRKLILVVANGGWDTTYALDPKPGSAFVDTPQGSVRNFSGLPILVDPARQPIEDFFTAYASQCALVNGLQVQSIVHSDCFKRILTGTPSDTNPDVGAIAASTFGRDRAAPYLVLGQTSYAGQFSSLTTKTGALNQLDLLLDPARSFAAGNPNNPDQPVSPDATEKNLIRTYLTDGARRLQSRRGAAGSNKNKFDDFVASLGRADALAEIGSTGEIDFIRGLDIQVDVALSAFERGVCWVAQLEAGNFDTHTNNAAQAEQQTMFFTGLSKLMQGLNTRPGSQPGTRMIDETVVVVLSEMGRTPRLNAAMGKDHWPITSALVLGAGVAGGRVIGGTDDRLGSRSLNLSSGAPDDNGDQLQYPNFAAGVLSLVGVDPMQHINAAPLSALGG